MLPCDDILVNIRLADAIKIIPVTCGGTPVSCVPSICNPPRGSLSNAIREGGSLCKARRSFAFPPHFVIQRSFLFFKCRHASNIKEDGRDAGEAEEQTGTPSGLVKTPLLVSVAPAVRFTYHQRLNTITTLFIIPQHFSHKDTTLVGNRLKCHTSTTLDAYILKTFLWPCDISWPFFSLMTQPYTAWFHEECNFY